METLMPSAVARRGWRQRQPAYAFAALLRNGTGRSAMIKLRAKITRLFYFLKRLDSAEKTGVRL
jgi:hypothetical protein